MTKPRHSTTSRKTPLIDHDAEPMIDDLTGVDETQTNDSQSNQPIQGKSWVQHRLTLSLTALGLGLIGGIVATVILSSLQYSGVIPAAGNKQLSGKIVTLQGQLQQLQTAQAKFIETASASNPQPLEQQQQSNGEVATLTQRVDQLEMAIKNSQQALERAAASFNANTGLTSNEPQLKLSQQEQVIANLKQLSDRALELGQSNQSALDDLQQSVVKLTNQKQIQGKEIAILTSVNSLKTAVDRGGSFVNELAIFRSVAPTSASLAMLQPYAGSGLANNAELSQRFAKVADAIVATQDHPASDASIWQKLWAKLKATIIARPIGDVMGNSPASIAARMEVAIKSGDYDKAMHEWQNLPPAAKDVSAPFIGVMRARQEADSLFAQTLATSLQSIDAPAKIKSLQQPESPAHE